MGTSARTMGISVTTTGSDQLLPLGFQYHEPAEDTNRYGERVWVYIRNEFGADLAAGEIVYRDPSSGDTTIDWWGVLKSPATNHIPRVNVVGVAQHAIADDAYGFVLVKGVGTILTGSAGLSADTAITTGGSAVGTGLDYADDTAGANIGVIGSTAAAIGAAATGVAMIDCGV